MPRVSVFATHVPSGRPNAITPEEIAGSAHRDRRKARRRALAMALRRRVVRARWYAEDEFDVRLRDGLRGPESPARLAARVKNGDHHGETFGRRVHSVATA